MNYYDILFARKMAGGQGEITTEGLSVTENGTYTAPEGKAYTPVVVNVPTPDDTYQLKSLPTGAISTITDGSNLPMPCLKVAIEPIQEGSGDPSPTNIRPISGWDECKVTRTGKNVFGGLPMAENIVEVGRNATLDTTNKTVTFTNCLSYDDNYERSISEGFKFKENTVYTFVATYSNSGNNNSLRFRNTTGTNQEILLTNTNGQKTKIAITASSDFSLKDIILSFYSASSTTLYYEESGLFEGTITAQDFEPYNGHTYTIELDGTRYGGKLDVVSGVLTVDKGYIASYNGETLPSTWISDRDVYVEGTSPTTGAQVVYELATPITIQLNPTMVKSLLGTNNIWADTGDVLEGSYFKEL